MGRLFVRAAPTALLTLATLCGCGEPPTTAAAPAPYVLDQIVEAEVGRRPEQVAELQAALLDLAEQPEEAAAHLAAGRALLLLDRAPGARWHLKQALDLASDPKRIAQAHYQLGVLEQRESRFEEAAAQFESAREHNPTLAVAHRDLGRALMELDRAEAAERALEQALALAPDDADCALLLALLIEPHDGERAIQLLEDASRLAPYHLGVQTNLASLYRRAGRSEEAELARRRHRELVVLADLGQLEQPEHPDRYLAESRYYAQHDQWEKAVEVCERALQRYPDHAELHFLGGMVNMRVNGPDAAQASYLRSLELRPRDRRVLEELAALQTAKRPAQPSPAAREALAEAARLWPDEARFQAALARIDAAQ